jgi:aspartyl-tRNA(Asn)/glutamyl-tRNA(Gln) amidotransferase subunit A
MAERCRSLIGKKLMPDDICTLAAQELIPLIQGRKISPVEIMKEVIARAERLQPRLNCFITLCADEALGAARAAEKALMSGKAQGPLFGIPYTVKDLVNTKGIRTTYGAVPYGNNIPREDAVAAERMKAAGAILIGKTTTPEFGTGPLTQSPLFGKTSNPWDPGRTCGGSSGGAGAAIAAGIAPLAIASDGGGSTRIPAAVNGVVGFKQSLGVIPHSQAPDKFGNMSFVTPTTRTVGDTALMMDVLAGGHWSDPTSIGLKAGNFLDSTRNLRDLKGTKFLHCLTPLGTPVSKDVKASFENALRQLAALGAEIEEFDGSGMGSLPVWRVIQSTVWMGQVQDLVAEHRLQMSAGFLQQIESAKSYTGLEYRNACVERSRLFAKVQFLLRPKCYLAMPTITRTALPVDQDLFGSMQIDDQSLTDIRAHWYPWTMLFNMTGHPAVSLPSGFGSDGLPIGLQIVGRHLEDADLMRVAATYEAANDWSSLWPSGVGRP